jgi:hypothetical protein
VHRGRHLRHSTASRITPQLSRRILPGIFVLSIYILLAVLVWWRVWVSGNPSTTMPCGCGDPAQMLWSFAWMRDALQHGLDPFFTRMLFVPAGQNLLDNTTVPLLTFVMSPITALWGPVVAFNVASTLAPVASAFCAYLALRRWVQWRPAAALGAALFGFSPFLLEAAVGGHLMLAYLCFPPLLLLVLHDLLVRQRRPWWQDGLLLAALVIGQFFLGVEILVLTLVVAGIGVLLFVLTHPKSLNRHAPHALAAFAAGIGATSVLLAWPLWFMEAGPRYFLGPDHPGLSEWSGTSLIQLLDAGASHAPMTLLELAGYFGPQGPPALFLGGALLSLLLVGCVAFRRTRILRWASVFFAVAVVFSLGLTGSRSGALKAQWWSPWRLFIRLPIFSNVAAARFVAVSGLFVALAFGLILDRSRTALLSSFRRWPLRRTGGLLAGGLVLLVGVAVLLPIEKNLPVPAVVQPVAVPAWFVHDAPLLPSGTTVLTYPFASSSSSYPLVWQALDEIRFGLVGGYGFVPGADSVSADVTALTPSDVLRTINFTPMPGPSLAQQISLVRAFLLARHVDIVVVAPIPPTAIQPGTYPFSYGADFYTAVIGRRPVLQDGSWVWSGLTTLSPARQVSQATLESCAAIDGGAVSMREPNCVLAFSRPLR